MVGYSPVEQVSRRIFISTNPAGLNPLRLFSVKVLYRKDVSKNSIHNSETENRH
jgi:hypothetical protein